MWQAPHPHPARAAFPTQRLHCELGLPEGGGPGVEGGPREWLWGPEVRRSGMAVEGGGVVEQGPGEHPGPRTSLVSLASLPCLSSRGVEGSVIGKTQPPGPGAAPGLLAGSARRLARVLSPCPADHTLTSSSSSASANSKVLACTVLGTGVLLPAWDAPHSSSRLPQEARTWDNAPTPSPRASTSV